MSESAPRPASPAPPPLRLPSFLRPAHAPRAEEKDSKDELEVKDASGMVLVAPVGATGVPFVASSFAPITSMPTMATMPSMPAIAAMPISMMPLSPSDGGKHKRKHSQEDPNDGKQPRTDDHLHGDDHGDDGDDHGDS